MLLGFEPVICYRGSRLNNSLPVVPCHVMSPNCFHMGHTG